MIANHSSEPANQVPELALRFLVFNGWIGHIHAAQINSYCSKTSHNKFMFGCICPKLVVYQAEVDLNGHWILAGDFVP